MTKIGFLGAGGVAGVHARAIEMVADAVVSAVFDVNGEAAARMAVSTGAVACATVDDLLRSCDAVYILTPPHTHRELAVKALKAGKPVMCEKPLAISLDDGRAIADTAATAGVPFMVGFSMRYRPSYRRLKAIHDSGSLGKPLTFWFQRMFGGGGYDPSNWRYRPESQSGMSIESLSHQIDLIRWIFGEIDTVYANVTASFPELPDVDNNVHALFTLENGASAMLHLSWSSYLSFNTTGINGTDGTVRIWGDGGADHDKMFLKTRASGAEEVTDLSEKYDEKIMANEGRGFLDLIHGRDGAGGGSDVPGVRDGLRALEISHAMLASSTEKHPIKV